MLKNEEIIQFINDDKSSHRKQMAYQGQRYYEAEHDIMQYRLLYYDADGNLKEDKNRSNIKISHPFFTELVDQKTQYMLSGKERFVFSDDPELQKELDAYFNENENFTAELFDLITGCSAKGYEYMYAYKDSEDKIAFQCADMLGVVEIEARDASDHTPHIIYWYSETHKRDKRQIVRVQVWDARQTYYYVLDNGKLIDDPYEEINPRPHIIYKATKLDGTEEVYSKEFGFIPFFRLDNNNKRFSDLKPIKGLIDDYDLMSCSLSNNLQDLTEGIFVVKGFAGDNMDEMIQNIKTKKSIGVSEDGDVDIRTVSIPYEARKTKMELDETNIYRFGMGFNSAQVGDGNITNIVIKSRYSLLDLKCNKLEIRLRQFIRKLLKIVIDEINDKYGTAYNQSNVYIRFEREIISNAADNASIEFNEAQTQQILVNTLLNLGGLLDGETIAKMVCDVLDIDFESIKDKLSILPDPEDETQTAIDTLDKVDVEKTEEEVGRTLNGAQTQSLINVVSQLSAGTISQDQAIQIISISIGVTEEKAKQILAIQGV